MRLSSIYPLRRSEKTLMQVHSCTWQNSFGNLWMQWKCIIVCTSIQMIGATCAKFVTFHWKLQCKQSVMSIFMRQYDGQFFARWLRVGLSYKTHVADQQPQLATIDSCKHLHILQNNITTNNTNLKEWLIITDSRREYTIIANKKRLL